MSQLFPVQDKLNTSCVPLLGVTCLFILHRLLRLSPTLNAMAPTTNRRAMRFRLLCDNILGRLQIFAADLHLYGRIATLDIDGAIPLNNH